MSFDKKLEGLEKLERGWDGYGPTAPISKEALKTARNLTPCPLRDGGIQLDLHAGGVDIEIVIEPDGSVRSVAFDRATK